MHYLELIKLELVTSVITNLPAPEVLVITQVDDHVKMKLISQLINGLSRFSKNYLNISISNISTFFVLPPAGVFPVISLLDLNDSESAKLSFGSFL